MLIAHETGEIKEYTAIVNYNKVSDTTNRNITIVKGHYHANNIDSAIITGVASAVNGFLTCGTDGYVKLWSSDSHSPLQLVTERRLCSSGDGDTVWLACLGLTSSVHINYGVSDSSLVNANDAKDVSAIPVDDVSLNGVVAIVVTPPGSKKGKASREFIQGTVRLIINTVVFITIII